MQDQKRRFRRMRERHNRTVTGRETRSTLVSGADAARPRRATMTRSKPRTPKAKSGRVSPMSPVAIGNGRSGVVSSPAAKRRRGDKDALQNRYSAFSRVLLEILDVALEQKCSGPFLYPVDLQTFPDYMDYVQTPIDMDTMRKRVENFHYQDLRSFTDDVQLMLDNAVQYCTGRYDDIITLGLELQTFILSEISRRRPRIDAALQQTQNPRQSPVSPSQQPPVPDNRYQHGNMMMMMAMPGFGSQGGVNMFDFLA